LSNPNAFAISNGEDLHSDEPEESPPILDVVHQRFDEFDNWIEVSEGDVTWVGDTVRYAATPSVCSAWKVSGVRVLRRPWDEPKAEYKLVGESQAGQAWAQFDPTAGHWSMLVEVTLSNGMVLEY
jgi:hypothetical protein